MYGKKIFWCFSALLFLCLMTPARAMASSGEPVASISAGLWYSTAINSFGELFAWGSNGDGQLGDGTTTNRNTPVRIGTASDWTAVGAGSSHSLAINSSGQLFSWGSASDGELGIGQYRWALTPTLVNFALSDGAQESAFSSYTVTFNSAGGSAVAAKSITNGAAVGPLPTPTRVGYAFDGWYTAAGAKISPTAPVTGSMTLTARWTPTHTFLKSLKVPGGKFKQGFEHNVFSYIVTLPKKKASTTVKVAKQNKNATVEFKVGKKWKKATTQKVSLKPGKSKTVTIRVKQKGLNTAIYKVKVTRAKK